MKIDKNNIKADCFAFRSISKDGCIALQVRNCYKCKTYKTKARAEAEREMVLKKLRAKPLSERMALAERYKIEGIV